MPIGRIGTDFIVDTTTTGDQTRPRIAVLADGRFVMTWDSDTGDGSFTCIRARLYNADGTASGNDFLVNTTTEGFQFTPTIAALANGRFVMTWESSDPGDGSESCIRARIYNADGTAAGNDFIVDTTTAGFQQAPAIAALADGRFVMTWTGDGIRARLYNADGTASGNDFVADTTTGGFNFTPGIAALADGRFVMTWPSSDGIRARIHSADGTASGNDLIVNTTPTRGYVSNPAIAALADGRFVMTWSSEDTGDGSFSCIRARLYNADGTASGNDFIVDTTTDGFQSFPAIAALADGRFVMTWTSGYDIRARLYNADGTASGNDFSVYTTTTFDPQLFSTIAALANGRFVVTWTSGDSSHFIGSRTDIGDGSGTCIRSQIFDAKVFIGTSGDDVYRGGSLNDTITGGGGNDTIDGGAGIDTTVYSTTRAGATITRNANGSVTVNAGADGIDTLTNVEYAQFSDATVYIGNTVVNTVVKHDFNGDGRSDILWRATSGDVYLWSFGAGLVHPGTDLGIVPTNYSIAGTGDLNGDGKVDALWRSDTGDVYLWNSANGGIGTPNGLTGIDLGIVPLSYTVAGLADFNGDGKADVLWRSDTGDVYLWNSSGGGIGTANGFQGIDLGIVPLSYQIAATADFNGDGKADVLWRSATGDVYLWSSTGAGIGAINGFQGTDLGIVPLSYQIAATGDFNGDGKTDVVWRSDTGDVYLWNSTGGGIGTANGLNGIDLGIVPLDYKIAGTGDFNSDGKADILFRATSSGDAYLWSSANGGIGAPGGFTGVDLGIVPTNYATQIGFA